MNADCSILYNPPLSTTCGPSCRILCDLLDCVTRVETACGTVFVTHWKGTSIKELHFVDGLPDADTRQVIWDWMRAEGFFESTEPEPVARELID
jgi:hypothetical protein